MNCVEMDGCSLVILREPSGLAINYVVVEGGCLTYDGETLELEYDDGSRRAVHEDEQREILPVTEHNQIPQCAGYRLFILRSGKAHARHT